MKLTEDALLIGVNKAVGLDGANDDISKQQSSKKSLHDAWNCKNHTHTHNNNTHTIY